MELQRLFERGLEDSLFTDYDVAVEGRKSVRYSGGRHVVAGARLFDIASLTKSCVHLVFLKLFEEGRLSPGDSYRRFVQTPQVGTDNRLLAHFMCNTVGNYGWDYNPRNGNDFGHEQGRIREALVERGFGPWTRKFTYDNVGSAYLGIALENFFGENLEYILRNILLEDKDEAERFVFHPVARERVTLESVVPTLQDETRRGRVHDPLSFQHEDTDISVAGIFSDAKTLARIFHRVVGGFSNKHYDEIASDQLPKLGVSGEPYGLGFDKPLPHRFEGLKIGDSLISTGHTGTRIFFARKPRITVCILTNYIFSDPERKRLEDFKTFCWQVLREAIRM